MSEKIITFDNLSAFKQKYDEEIDKKIPEGIKELTAQYVRITDLDTGIYKLTYAGTKYLYYYGTSNTTNKTTVGTSTAPCLLYVQRYSTTYWHWEYSYASGSIRKTVKGWTSSASGGSTTLLLPSTAGTSGQYLKSNGSSSAPAWTSLCVPDAVGTSGQYLKSNGTNTPVWSDAPAPTYFPVYSHFGTGLTVQGLGDLTMAGGTVIGYKLKITKITGDQPPKLYPTACTFCFWYQSISIPVIHVDKQGTLASVTDLTFAVGANSYLAYTLKNTTGNTIDLGSGSEGNAFTICQQTSSLFSMTAPTYFSM